MGRWDAGMGKLLGSCDRISWRSDASTRASIQVLEVHVR